MSRPPAGDPGDAAEVVRVAIACIGTELTRGEIHNTNATWLAERLTALGAEVTRIQVVADDAADIERCLEQAASECRAVVVTGGLGPTTDDITSRSAARWLGVELRRDPGVLAGLAERLARRGRTLTPSNESQADFPEGASILENPHGTAPGFCLEIGRSSLFFLPGVPREMKPMFERFAAPRVRGLVSGGHFQACLRCFGLPESTINDRLEGLEASHGVRVGYRAHFPEVEVKLSRRDASRELAELAARAAAAEARARLGSAVYGEGEAQLPERVTQQLRERGLRLAAAESCTGGLLSSLVTAHPASDVFVGAVVSYDNRVKVRQLDVEPELLDRRGAVSPEVAAQMATGVRLRLGADLGVALTGIAGPTGGTPDKPVGLVCYAVSSRLGVVGAEVLATDRPRQGVQLYSAWCALFLLRELLLGDWRELLPESP